MTDDPGVKDMLKFLLARDTMHQNQWLAAIEELKADGLEQLPVPGDFPSTEQHEEYAYQLWNFSSGQDSRQGRWASGPAPDGRAEFGYVEEARPMATEPMLPAGGPTAVQHRLTAGAEGQEGGRERGEEGHPG